MTLRDIGTGLGVTYDFSSTSNIGDENTTHQAGNVMFPTGPRWAVHLIVDVPTLGDALLMAEQLATSLAFLPQLDSGETTVSAEDEQSKRYRVFCDRALPERCRCTLPSGHGGPCSPIPNPAAPSPKASNAIDAPKASTAGTATNGKHAAHERRPR